jgi:hypothetical protein
MGRIDSSVRKSGCQDCPVRRFGAWPLAAGPAVARAPIR